MTGRSQAPSLLTAFLSIILHVTFLEPVSAQDVAVATPDGSMNESLEPAAAVSGSPLVGLSLGVPERGPLDFDDIRLAFPLDRDGRQRICVRATTRDGRYMSNTPYVVENAKPVVRLDPATRISDQLSRYDAGDFAIRAYLSADGDCSPAGKLNLPVVRAGDTGVLLVTANGKSRTGEARLETRAGVTLVSAACKSPVGSALIAFDLLCSLDRSGFLEGGPAVLVLTFDDGFDTEAYRYDVLLPKGN